MNLVLLKKEILEEISRGGCTCLLIEEHLGQEFGEKYSEYLMSRFPTLKFNERTIVSYIRDKKFYEWKYPRFYDLAYKIRARLVNQFFKKEFGI